MIDPFKPHCAVCAKAFNNDEVFGVVPMPDGHIGIVHLCHRGMRDLIEHPSQIITASLLRTVAEDLSWLDTDSADAALARFAVVYTCMPDVQRMRLSMMDTKARTEEGLAMQKESL